MKLSLATLTVVLMFTTAAQAEQKLLTVDMVKAYNGYHKTQSAEAAFRKTVEQVQAEIKRRVDAGRALASQINKMRAKLKSPDLPQASAPALRADIETQIKKMRRMEAELADYRKQSSRTFEQKRQAIIKLYTAEVRDAVAKIAKARQATIVLNAADKNTVVYAIDAVDITDEVVKLVNADQPK